MRRGPVWLWFLLGLLTWSAPASAFDCKRSEKYDWISLRWNRRVIQYGLHAGADAEVSHIESAFGTWSSNDCTDIRFEYIGIVEGDQPDVNQVVFIRENWSNPIGREPRPSDAVAVTLTTYTKDDGEIQSAIIEVNEERFSFAEVTEECSAPETYDLIAVITHEVGHFIGLDHTTFFTGAPGDPTMAPRVGECEADKRTLEGDDIEGLCLIYPRGQPARSCMALPSEPEYVRNRVFGCSASSATSRGLSGLSLLAMGTIFLIIARRRGQNLR